MTNRFPGQKCVLCDSPSEGVGEHVLPAWFLRDSAVEGPFITDKAGIPYRTRAGKAEHPNLSGVHVPMCQAHNSLLNQTIEEPAKPIVRRLFADGADTVWPRLDTSQAGSLAKWLVKVGVLWAHPESSHDHPDVNRDDSRPRLVTITPDWLSWMAEETEPPDAFSVYVQRQPVRDDEPVEVIHPQHIHLPHEVVVDHTRVHFAARTFGLRSLRVTIVWHPGWPIDHPLLADGKVIRLHPTDTAAELHSLPVISPKAAEFMVVPCSVQTSAEDYQRLAPTHPLGASPVPALWDFA